MGASSARLYRDSYNDRDSPPITVPAGWSIFPKGIFCLPRGVAERRFTDLLQWRELDRSGRVAALEQPGPVEKLRTFSATCGRQAHACSFT
jgi:hypothetical protein